MPVEHDPSNQKFYVKVGEDEAFLRYSQNKDVLDFYQTFVPVALRGKGLAEEVVKAGFEWAKANNFRVKPSCSYVSPTFLKKHSEYNSLCQAA